MALEAAALFGLITPPVKTFGSPPHNSSPASFVWAAVDLGAQLVVLPATTMRSVATDPQSQRTLIANEKRVDGGEARLLIEAGTRELSWLARVNKKFFLVAHAGMLRALVVVDARVWRHTYIAVR